MSDDQPPPYILARIMKQRGQRYGPGWIAAGSFVVIATLLLLAWLLSR